MKKFLTPGERKMGGDSKEKKKVIPILTRTIIFDKEGNVIEDAITNHITG